MAYAKGKRAFGYCDKTGFRYPLNDLVYEYKDGHRTGFRVGKDVVDPDHPQNFLGRVRVVDPQSLRNPRPDNSIDESRSLFGWRPVGHPLVYVQGSVGTVTVETGD
ncbi:MAG TPA: hypothetical protein VIG24_07450 [Acidimicrobiia bacterium]